MYLLAIILGKLISWISRFFHLGAGATWPGEIALRLQPSILRNLQYRFKKGIVIIAGTNGKTTTSLMIKTILESQGETVIHNASGANLLNGIVSAIITKWQKHDWGVFEVDENTVPSVLQYIEPTVIVLLNLFRDQLDRYGEVDAVATKWRSALERLQKKTTIIANADDPTISYITQNLDTSVVYIGLENEQYYLPKMQHATDAIYCPKCGTRLTFGGFYFSHLGKWACGTCGLTHPDVRITSDMYKSPLEGVYNIYNTIAAAAVGEQLGIKKDVIQQGLSQFIPAFGRMEQLQFRGKNVRILLSKNPTGFNESLRTITASNIKGPLLLALNDRIPDGRDVSWIWDVDFEQISSIDMPVIISGDRAYDLGLRIKYGELKNELIVTPDVKDALDTAFSQIQDKETLWILATYSAMLDIRKLLTGKKIL